MIAIIDYDAGNIKSVEKAVAKLGREAVLTKDHDAIMAADHVILPGVGSFGDAMERIRAYGLDKTISEVVSKGTPFLGICLGLQLMFEESEESKGVKGLGLLKGKIVRFSDEFGLKIPQIGWNSLEFPKESRLFKDIPEGAYVYFVHSYYLDATDKSIVAATTEYGNHVEAAVETGNLFACQFHPEKSSDIGLKIIENFLSV